MSSSAYSSDDAKTAAVAAYNSVLAALDKSPTTGQPRETLLGEHLRAWAEQALSLLTSARVGAVESATLDPIFTRFASRQGFLSEAGQSRPLPRALCINGASVAFLLEAAPKLRTARKLAEDNAARAAKADLDREHPRKSAEL